jgi:hypothetical protein
MKPMKKNIKCPHCHKWIDLSKLMSELGKLSAEARKNKTDYSAMGKKSAEKRWGKKD